MKTFTPELFLNKFQFAILHSSRNKTTSIDYMTFGSPKKA